MTKPTAVVTGGAGFIGSHMVDLLVERGFAVRAIDNLYGGRRENLAQHARNPDIVLEERDIRSYAPEDPLFRGARHVFHFAGIGDIVPSIERPRDYMRANVDGTLAVLEASRRAGVKKFVYAASSSCYGANAPVPTPESAPSPASRNSPPRRGARRSPACSPGPRSPTRPAPPLRV